MKGFAVLFLATCVAVLRAEDDVQYLTECPSEQEGNWGIEMLLRHEDCDKFYKCTLGQPVEYNCYDGLYFNLVTWQCDWKENVDCTDRNIPDDKLSSTLGPITVPTNQPTTEPTQTTTAPETTVVPTTSAPTTITDEATTLELTTSTTTSSPTTTVAPEGAPAPGFQANGCPVDPHIHWLLPHESDCNLFYYCVWGQKVLRNCDPVLHFNPTLQVCDWPITAGCTVALNKHNGFIQRLRQLL